MAKKLTLTIAPKLANNNPRVRDYGRLPEDIKEGLRDTLGDWLGLIEGDNEGLKEGDKDTEGLTLGEIDGDKDGER